MDRDPDREVEPADTLDEADGLVPISIKSESPGSGKTPGVHLRGMGWQANRTNRPGNGADASHVSNTSETAGRCDGWR